MTKKQWHVNKQYNSLRCPNDDMCFKRVIDAESVLTMTTLQDMADKLNYAEENMPPPNKAVEEFLELRDEEMSALFSTLRGLPSDHTYSTGAAWDYLRPEIRKRGYWLEVSDKTDGVATFRFGKGGLVICESATTTLNRFICACYLYVMQEGAK